MTASCRIRFNVLQIIHFDCNPSAASKVDKTNQRKGVFQMKQHNCKRFSFLFLLGLFVAIFAFTADSVTLEAAKKTTVSSKKQTKVTKKSSKTKKLTTKITNWKIADLHDLEGILEDEVIYGFDELGFVVTVDKNEANRYGYSGCFSPSRQTIILKKAHTQTLIHEIGHFVDFVTDYQSSSKSFTKIYKSEKKKAKTFYNTPSHTLVSAREYFAESFNAYYSNPAKLKSKCPKTYAYMVKAVKSVTYQKISEIQDRYGFY